MHTFTLVHVGKPGKGPAPFHIQKVKAHTSRQAMAPFCGRRLTAEEIKAATR